MEADVDVAAVARVLSDPTRVRFLLELGEGRQRSAGELAGLAGLSPSAASFHLARLADAGLVRVDQRGKRRFFAITDPMVPRALEAMAMLAPKAPVRSLRQSRAGHAVRFARICDGHLAGYVGVALPQAMVRQGLLDQVTGGYAFNPAGIQRLDELGVKIATATDDGTTESMFVPSHPDWSHDAHHLAGPLASALTNRLLELGWISHRQSGRAVRVASAGRSGLHDHFGIDLDA